MPPILHQNTTPKTETDVINNKYYFLLHIWEEVRIEERE